MARLVLLTAALALVSGVTSAARITGRNPYWLGVNGGVTLYIDGEDFNEDQLTQYDPILGNRVSLVNEEDEIECSVIRYLTNGRRIVCVTGPRTRPSAPEVYEIVVFSNGVRAEGTTKTVRYAWWLTPNIQTATPLWSVPGVPIEFTGDLETTRYHNINLADPLEDNPDQGTVLTKLYVGGDVCHMSDENGDLLGPFSRWAFTCRPITSRIAPMRVSLFVNERGSNLNDRHGSYVDSQDKLYTYHSYPAITSITPATGSPSGGTLLTVDGSGFDSLAGKTKVEVGGGECDVQEVTNNQLKCLTPAQPDAPSGGGRGVLVELYKGETVTDQEFWSEERWAALDSSNAGYESFTSDAQMLKFPLTITESTAGRIRAYFNPPHDGLYFVLGSAGDKAAVRIAADGNPDNADYTQPIELTQGVPAYVEVRFRASGNTNVLLRMKDFNSRYVNKQTFRAGNEKQRYSLDISQVMEKQSITITGAVTPATLYMNGINSAPVDISNSTLVVDQLMDMMEQKCERDFSSLDTRHHSTFEEGDKPPSIRGSTVENMEPFCGRKMYKLYRYDPRIYRETDDSKMVNANIHKYLCFAVMGKLTAAMAINFVYNNNEGKRKDHTFWFNRDFSPNGWTYHCEDLQAVMTSSWAGSSYTPGNKLLVKNVVLPKPAGPLDDVYVDEVVFASDSTIVSRTRPSAVKNEGILIDEIEVLDETETGYSLRFTSYNCENGMPLLGIFDGPSDNSLLETLKVSDAYTFTLGEGTVAVEREAAATGPLGGTWDLSVSGRTLKDLPADVHPIVLESYLEAALGTDVYVSTGGSCKNYYYYVEWKEEPGLKELGVVDGSNLEFDGIEVNTPTRREWEGMIWHDPLPADFMTAYSDTPQVTLRVNGYSAACQGDCAFSFVSSDAISQTGSNSPVNNFVDPITLSLSGTGFTSNELSDYYVSVGDIDCSVDLVDNMVAENQLQASCQVAVAGSYAITAIMQPYGTFSQESTVTFAPVIDSVSITEGFTTGYYPATITGKGFQPDLAFWSLDNADTYVMIGAEKCDVIAVSPTEVTFVVPPGEAAGSVSGTVRVNGADASFSFTYTAASVIPSIASLSLSSFSVYGGEELIISGSNFGIEEGTVKIGSLPCEVTAWTEASVTCTTPSLAPGSHTLQLMTQGFGVAETTANYVFSVTSTSLLKGSVKGGTTVVLKGEGFGSDCSLLSVRLGDKDECVVTACTSTSLTCVTRIVPTTYEITNTGSSDESSVLWLPRVVDLREGDTVLWKWNKVSDNSQLSYSVCSVPDPLSSCDDDDGTGFNSGSPAAEGEFSVTFTEEGVVYYAGQPASTKGLIMRGQINVVRPSTEALKMTLFLGEQEATIDLSGGELESVATSCSANQDPLPDCTEPDPTVPEDGNLYFLAHVCHTPIITSLASDSETPLSVPGLSGVQVLEGMSLVATGSGFNDAESFECNTEVFIGSSSCAVSQSTDASLTCSPNFAELPLSYLPVTVQVFGNGNAALQVSNHKAEGSVVAVPYVSSFSPTGGSLAGGTLITLTGSGLQGVVASPRVFLGGSECVLQDVSPSSVTCLTPSSATPTTASLIVTVLGVQATLADTVPIFTYSEALTPHINSADINSEQVTLSGQNFGSDGSKLTITLKRVTSRRVERMAIMEEEELEKVEELILWEDEDIIEDFEDDEELERMVPGYIEEREMSAADAVRWDKARPIAKPKLKLIDLIEVSEGFWGTFTGTGAKTFKETVRLGAWRRAGTAATTTRRDEDNEETNIVPTRRKRSIDDLPEEYSCSDISASDTSVTCSIAGLPAGSYEVSVSVDGSGDALENGLVSTAAHTVTSLQPSSGSVNGGASLVIAGSGFIDGDTAVTVGGTACDVQEVTFSSVSCITPSGTDGSDVPVVISVTGSSDVTADTTFAYSAAVTPSLDSVTPASLTSGASALTLSGTGFKQGETDPQVMVGDASCEVTSASDTEVICTAPELAGGSYSVVVREAAYGDSNSASLVYEFVVDADTYQGGFGGSLITISGQGFDPAGGTLVTVCDDNKPCDIQDSPTTSEISCIVPPEPFTGSDKTCTITVTQPSGDVNTDLSYQYLTSLTTSITSVSPKRGGTAGGTSLTITGTGFATSGNVVTIGGSPCQVTDETETSITCRTSDHPGTGQYPVMVEVPGNGFSMTDDSGEFFYIDVWSSQFTWDNQPPPGEGQLALVDEGQTVLFDASTPVLKMLLIQGGHVIFDREAAEELVLRTEYVLIVEGGSLSIGSEEEPFEGDAVIELYGNHRSIELPIYGSKVLAVREGSLDLHGSHIPHTWTYLQQTAEVGATSVTLADAVTWKPGDAFVIAATSRRFPRNENEVRTILSVSDDGQTITFSEPLEFEHISVVQTLAGQEVATRAEVGLLSRNIKIRGNINEDFLEEIEGCEEEFNPNQFATQTCFQGRYGDETVGDQFGATVMLSGVTPDPGLVAGRLEYVEVTEAGQAFQLGRYPLHFHLVGSVAGSYIRGCSVHRTYNRAITIHAANDLLIERNVAFNNKGHAIFTEDGVEQNNIIQYNLAVFTRTSSSLLNVDITPASYWVVNPNNIVRHNAAAGGTHFGYWYRTERHPSGPSATNSYCPNNEVMGQFFNNTAHSFGRYGLWVFSMDGYHPLSGTCSGTSLVAKWEDFTVWFCERGAEVVFGSDLQFHNFVALNNERSGMEMVKVTGGNRIAKSPGVFNSMVICHSELGSEYCTSATSGIIAPKQYTFSISGVTFVNFDVEGSSALSGCSQCKFRQGGFRMQVEGLNFVSSPNRLKFKWQFETIWRDEDGSLGGTAGTSIVPWMDILPAASCTVDPQLSVNTDVEGAVCSSDMKFLRYTVEGDSIDPPSLEARDLIVSNSHGNVTVPYRVKRLTTKGWMGVLFAGDTFEWYFDDSSQITNIFYKAQTRLISEGDYFYIKHSLMQTPDTFSTTGEEQESKLSLPDPATDFHGDYYWDADAKEMTYMVSERLPSRRGSLREFTMDAGLKRNINFRVYQNPPTPPPFPTGRPDAVFLWSDVETWKEVPVGSGGHPTETEYNLPVENDEIIIPPGMWLVVDTETPKLRRVYVYGTLEFDDTMSHTFEATTIYIQGGMVVAGFSKEKPFTNNLDIVLRGSIDPDDPDNEEFTMPEGVPSVGWKSIGVFGYLLLHGVTSGSSWYKLGATAEAGSTTLNLSAAPGDSWVGQEVVVTTTSKESTESEVRTVTAVDGVTLTLDAALEFEHLGVTHDFSGGVTATLAGEVGLLSRNIVVRGTESGDRLGGRILVSQMSQDGVDYVGSIQLHGVRLDNMGQESFTSLNDPRYALAMVNVGAIEEEKSYITKSSFSTSYNVALGLIGTSNMVVEDNVMYYVLDSGIRDETGLNTYKNNLVSTVLFLGTYGDRFETQNLNFYGAFELKNAPNIVLQGNVVAGAEQAGFMTYGEMCEDEAQWANNEVHGTTFGVMAWKKSGQGEECRRIHDFLAWRITDTAFYVQHYASSHIENVVSVDNLLGVNQLIHNPPALSHNFRDKVAIVKDSIFVGASPSHTCVFQKTTPEIYALYNAKLWHGGVNGGITGILFGTFMSGPNMAPKKKFSPPTSYPALHGKTQIEGVTFVNFGTRTCGTNIALMANPGAEDAVHPISVSGLTFINTDNRIFIPRANVGSVNPSDCVDMDCDGLKKVVLSDSDGSLLGADFSTLISEAEYEWDGDARRGVGDYRIPIPLKQNDDGTEITAAEKFPNKGIVRDDSCVLDSAWQAWKCSSSLQHLMLIIESMDTDTEVRRLSPIALIANPGTSGYVDLLNGPMDRGWCFGYTCQERISTFYSVVANEQTYELALTSTPPQVIRLHTLTTGSEKVILRMYFPKLQRYDVYVGDTFVPPTNIDDSVTKYQLIPENPDDPEAFFPTMDSPVGSNYLQRSQKSLHVVVGEGQLVTIKTTPMITLQSGLVVTNDEFYEENLLQNIIDLFGLSEENIRVTNIVPEDSRKRSTRSTIGYSVTAEIASGPTTSPDSTDSASGSPVVSYVALASAHATAVNKFQEGACESCTSFSSIEPVSPPPDEAPPKATPEEGSVILEGEDLFSNKQQEEEAEKLEESLKTTEFAQPSEAVLAESVSAYALVDSPFIRQPSIQVLDEEGQLVTDLGTNADPWQFTAELKGGAEGATLLGTTTVPYVDGAATFTDLAVDTPGDGYSLTFSVSYPSDAPSLSVTLEGTFNVRSQIPMSARIAFPQDTLLLVNQPIPISIQLVDDDSGELLDATLLQDQILIGTLMERRNNGESTLVDSFYEIYSGKAEITYDITHDTPLMRYELTTEITIVPNEQVLTASSGRMVIYPEGVSLPEGYITKNVGLMYNYGRYYPATVEEFEDAAIVWPVENIDMVENNLVWSAVNASSPEMKKSMIAYMDIMGAEADVNSALYFMCVRLRRIWMFFTVDCIPRRLGQRARMFFVDGVRITRCRNLLRANDEEPSLSPLSENLKAPSEMRKGSNFNAYDSELVVLNVTQTDHLEAQPKVHIRKQMINRG